MRASCRCIEKPNATESNQAYPALVTQENHYDPWGVAIEQEVVADKTKLPSFELKDRFTYNSKELQGTLNYLDYGARMYDATIGRENGIDQLSELDFETSPYVYAGNNPVRFVDLFGLKKGDANDPYVLDEVTVKGQRLPQNRDFWLNVSIAYTRNQLLYGHASPYRAHFQSGGRDAVVAVVGVPLAIAGIGTLASVSTAQLLTGAQRIAALRRYSQARKLLRLQGAKHRLWYSKLALSLTGQYVGFKLDQEKQGRDFSFGDIDLIDVAADQFLGPISGAVTSSYLDYNTTDQLQMNGFKEGLVGAALGTVGGVSGTHMEKLPNMLNGVSANATNYVLQLYQTISIEYAKFNMAPPKEGKK